MVSLPLVIGLSLAGVVMLCFLMGILFSLYKASERKRKRKRLEADVLEYEKARARNLLVQLHDGPGGNSVHQPPFPYPPIGAPGYPQPGMPPPAMGPPPLGMGPPPQAMGPPPPGGFFQNEIEMGYPQQVVVHHYDMDGYPPQLPPALPPGRYNDYDDEYDEGSGEEDDMPRMRMAEHAGEMPTTPPPEAPAGFRTVPMVIETP